MVSGFQVIKLSGYQVISSCNGVSNGTQDMRMKRDNKQ